jgi:DNA-binding response OmpR family regulator
MSARILLVETDSAVVAQLLAALQTEGYAVTVSDSFEAAVAVLRTQTFHAVLAAHHLGAHNGLHLIVRARFDRPDVMGIVMSPAPDAVLDGEANALGALSVASPWKAPAGLLLLLHPAGSQPA